MQKLVGEILPCVIQEIRQDKQFLLASVNLQLGVLLVVQHSPAAKTSSWNISRSLLEINAVQGSPVKIKSILGLLWDALSLIKTINQDGSHGNPPFPFPTPIKFIQEIIMGSNTYLMKSVSLWELDGSRNGFWQQEMKTFVCPRLESEVAFMTEFGIALRHQHWTVWMANSCHLLPFIQLLDPQATLIFCLITKASNLCLTMMWLTDAITKWVRLATCLLLQAVLNHTQHVTTASGASWKPYLWSAVALFCLPSSQHTEREVLLKDKSRKAIMEKRERRLQFLMSGKAVQAQNSQKKHIWLTLLPNAFLYMPEVKFCGSHIPKQDHIKENLLLWTGKEGETKILFDMLEHVSFSQMLN